MARKLAEVDLSKLAVPVEKTKGRKRKSQEEHTDAPPAGSPESVVAHADVVKEKKPRTEKQLAADAKRREAAAAKKAEKEAADKAVKDAEVQQLLAAAEKEKVDQEKKRIAAEKRKAARELKKAAEAALSELEDPEDKSPVLPAASSVPAPKETKPRKPREPELTSVKERPKSVPAKTPKSEEPFYEKKFDQEKYNEWMRKGQTYYGRQSSIRRLR